MSDTTEKLGAHEVATWLRRHPGFLKQFPDLALTLVVPREEGSAASLASYQLEVLRDKNRELARRLQELFANAQENERLSVRTHQLTLALMRQTSAADTVRAMAASLAEDFNGDLVRLVLLQPVAGLDDADWLQQIDADDARLQPFRDCLVDGEPLCGRLQPEKHALLYGMRAGDVQSTALLPLPGVGLIAVGSRDANRFFPGMGTLFLRMMGESLATALSVSKADDEMRLPVCSAIRARRRGSRRGRAEVAFLPMSTASAKSVHGSPPAPGSCLGASIVTSSRSTISSRTWPSNGACRRTRSMPTAATSPRLSAWSSTQGVEVVTCMPNSCVRSSPPSTAEACRPRACSAASAPAAASTAGCSSTAASPPARPPRSARRRRRASCRRYSTPTRPRRWSRCRPTRRSACATARCWNCSIPPACA